MGPVPTAVTDGAAPTTGAGAGHRPLDPRAVLDALPDPVVLVDAAANLVWGNRAAAAWSGWTLDDLRGRAVAGLVHPDDLTTALASLASVQEKEIGTTVELRLRDRSGTYRRFEVRGRAALDEPGVGAVALVLRDVTDRRRWEVAAGGSQLLQVIVDHAAALTMLVDRTGRLRGASRALTTVLGRPVESTLGRPVDALADRLDAGVVAAELAAAACERGARMFEARFTDVRDGSAVPMSVTIVNALDDSSVEGLIVTAVDITPLATHRAHLQRLASHDPLTGLPNRTVLFDRLHAVLPVAERVGGEVTVVYCDVDGFKALNDRHGHAAGDEVLVEVGRRLLASAGDATVARVGGDEFVVVAEVGPDGARALVDRLRAGMQAPMVLTGGRAERVSLSIGTATGTGTATDLVSRADQAMYRAKRSDQRPARRCAVDVPRCCDVDAPRAGHS